MKREAEEEEQGSSLGAKKAKTEEPVADDGAEGSDSGDSSGDGSMRAEGILEELISLFREKKGRDPTESEIEKWRDQLVGPDSDDDGDDPHSDADDDDDEEVWPCVEGFFSQMTMFVPAHHRKRIAPTRLVALTASCPAGGRVR